MKALIVIVVFLLVPEVAMAARWETNGKPIPVWDFTPEVWSRAVRATVDDFNTNLPPSVPRLEYIPMGVLPCEALPETGKVGGISVCQSSSVDLPGRQPRTVKREVFVSGMIAINAGAGTLDPTVLTCHEFTHAVFDAPDQLGYPHPDDSCVQGRLNHLGAWDIAYATQVYAPHDSGPRNRSHGKHHRAKRGRA